ncbi:MAG: glycosyltransferase [Rhizobiaceae bacterium]
MKLAFFTSIVPDGNATTGFEIANDAIIAGLRELGHEVVIFGFKLPRQGKSRDTDVVTLGTRELENSTAGTAQKLLWVMQAMRHGLPFAAAKLADFPVSQLAEAIERAGPFDGHILNSYQMAAAFPQLCDVPHIYVAHNVEHRSAAQNAAAVSSAAERWLYRRDERLLKKLEGELTQRARIVWTFSEADIDGHDLAPDHGCLLPLFVPSAAEPVDISEPEYDVGLIGTWSWQPNFVGLQWFVEEVAPLLPPGMQIAIAGSIPTTSLRAGPNIQFLGRVESANGFLDSVRVVPLISRGGTGVQLKTIEAFQTGRPCVATQSSLRGIDELPSNCLAADDPPSFAEALTELVEVAKSGTLPAVDGQKFRDRQKTALMAGLQRGIAHLA